MSWVCKMGQGRRSLGVGKVEQIKRGELRETRGLVWCNGRSADWQSAVARIGTPQTSRSLTCRLPVGDAAGCRQPALPDWFRTKVNYRPR